MRSVEDPLMVANVYARAKALIQNGAPQAGITDDQANGLFEAAAQAYDVASQIHKGRETKVRILPDMPGGSWYEPHYTDSSGIFVITLIDNETTGVRMCRFMARLAGDNMLSAEGMIIQQAGKTASDMIRLRAGAAEEQRSLPPEVVDLTTRFMGEKATQRAFVEGYCNRIDKEIRRNFKSVSDKLES